MYVCNKAIKQKCCKNIQCQRFFLNSCNRIFLDSEIFFSIRIFFSLFLIIFLDFEIFSLNSVIFLSISVVYSWEGGITTFCPLGHRNILGSILSFYISNCSNIFQYILFPNRIETFWSRDIWITITSAKLFSTFTSTYFCTNV